MESNNGDFDQIIDRKNTGSMKWEIDAQFFETTTDLLPLWVADMDFRCPKPILDALHKRVEHGIFGYTNIHPGYYTAVLNWFARRYQWQIQKDWLVYTPGIVPAIKLMVQAFSAPKNISSSRILSTIPSLILSKKINVKFSIIPLFWTMANIIWISIISNGS